MNHKRIFRVAVVTAALSITGLATWTWATATASPIPHNFVIVQPEEDEPGWDCTTMGNESCRPTFRDHPTHIIGHYRTGFHVWWSSGSETVDPPWSQIVNECHHDQAPNVCITAWSGQYRMYGMVRSTIRSQR